MFVIVTGPTTHGSPFAKVPTVLSVEKYQVIPQYVKEVTACEATEERRTIAIVASILAESGQYDFIKFDGLRWNGFLDRFLLILRSGFRLQIGPAFGS